MAEMIYANDLKQAMKDAGMFDYVRTEVVFKSAWGVPIVDAEEVVRCRDCKYKVGENTKYNDAHCGIHERGNNRELTVGDYDYCSWGELKESEGMDEVEE